MSQPFDPYEKWFEVPPEQRPINHYQLLGIKPFEPSLKVIRAAGEKRVEFLQDVSSGQHVDVAQRCLNEVAKAVLCLTNPKKKLAYDHQLKNAGKAKTTAKPTTSETPVAPAQPISTDSAIAPPSVSEFAINPDVAPASTSRTAPKKSSAKKPVSKKASTRTSSRKTAVERPEGPDSELSWWKKNQTLVKSLSTVLMLIVIGSLIAVLMTRNGSKEKGKDKQEQAQNQKSPSTSPTKKGRNRKAPGAPVVPSEPVKLLPHQFKRLETLRGQQVTLVGIVVGVGESKSKKTKFLFIGKDRHKGMTATMQVKDLGPDLKVAKLREKFQGKKLEITGKVVGSGGGRNRIKVTSEQQLKIVDQ